MSTAGLKSLEHDELLSVTNQYYREGSVKAGEAYCREHQGEQPGT